MKIIDCIKNIYVPAFCMPRGFVHNSIYDAILLKDSFNKEKPEFVRARDGKSYVYFERIDDDLITMVRKMGLNPCSHKSSKYFPAKKIYRVHISRKLPSEALNIIHNLRMMSDKFVEECKEKPEYIKYIENYQKTK
jgi:hypothetical protein